MHPVLGTMMPEICEAPHLSDSPLYSSLCSGFNVGRCVHLILLYSPPRGSEWCCRLPATRRPPRVCRQK
ncbi:hypothetical protein AOY73_19610 [Escherichia coli]|nr:hypothetical protein AOY73_19610 [Escherichia coli]